MHALNLQCDQRADPHRTHRAREPGKKGSRVPDDLDDTNREQSVCDAVCVCS